MVAVMKLNDFVPQIKLDPKVQRSQESAKAAKGEAGSAVAADRVDLSVGSLDLQKMKEIITKTPDVRMDRVQALKAQIERGDYEVDPYRVADKMLMNFLAENDTLKG